MPRFVKVASRSEVPEQAGTCVEVDGKRIAVFQIGGEFYAVDDECTHQGGPLSEGSIEGSEVECPWHGACFDLRTGEVTNPPAEENIATYPVRVTGDDVEVEV